MAKRIFALLLAFTLLFSAVPVQAFATATDDVAAAETSNGNSVFLEDVMLSVTDQLDAVKAAAENDEETETPVEETEAPVEETEAPVEETEAPVEETEAPAEETEAPVEETEAPVEETEPSVEETEAPVEGTEAPVEETEPPTEPEKEYASNVVPEGYVPRSYTGDEDLDMSAEEVKFPNRRVLLIEDNLPWDSDANHQILRTLAEFDVVKPSDVGKVDVSKYAVIILANDQATSSYTAYARFADKIEEFAERGGVIVFGACDAGWSAGYMSDIIPGGVKKANRYTYNNTIVDGTHPIVIGQLTDNKTLTDSHLYSNYCSHTYFLEDTFPEGTRVILRERNGYPTLIEYPLGNGRVIASGLTWEHNYVYTRTFSPVAMDDLYNYALYVSGIGNQDLEHLMHNKIKDTDHMIIVVDEDTLDPIAKAEINFDGKKYTTDEEGKVLIENVKTGRVKIAVKKTGYKSKTLQNKVSGGDMKYIFLEKYAGTGSYVTGAHAKEVIKKADGTKQTNEYDLFLETLYLRDDAEYTITLSGEWGSNKADKYMMYIGSQYAYSSNGVFTFKNGLCSNNGGKQVDFSDGRFHVRMVSKDGKQSEAAQLNFYVPKESEGDIWKESDTLFSIGGKDGIKIQIPKEMPVIGGAEFKVQLDEIPVCVELKEDSVKIAIGINKLKGDDPEKAMADWEKQWEAVDRTANLKEVMKKFGGKAGGFTLKKGWDTDLDIIGYAEGKYNSETDEITEISGGFIVNVDLMYKYNQQFIVGPVPVYFELGGGVELKDEGKVQGILVGAKQLILDNELTVTPKFSIGGGVGINGALSVGAEGTAKLPIVLCKSTWNPTDGTMDVYTNVSLSGEMDLTASLLFVFNARHSIAKGEWQILRYYWDTGKVETFESDLAAMSVTDFSDTGSFSLMSRSYLNRTSDWYTEDLTAAAFQNGMTVLQTGVMPTSDPQIVYTADGTAVMVFQADMESRSSLNRSCLMYSVFTNGIWATPQPVWDNGCADMAASLATGKAGTYVVWQKLNQELPDSATVDQMATHVEIASAMFDPTTNTFVDAAYLTNDDVLQMMPSAAVGATDAVAHYVTNTSSQLLGGGTNKIIRTSLLTGSSETIYSGTSYVTCLTASVGSKSVNTAYILDADNNMDTVEDQTVHVNGSKIYEAAGAQLNAQYDNGTLYWYNDAEDTIYTYSGSDAKKLLDSEDYVGTNFQIMKSSNGKFAVVWIGANGEGQNCVYARIKSGKSWSAPVEIVTSDASLMQIAGYLDDQGKWELIALAKEGENSAKLLYSGVTPYLTTQVHSITYLARNREDRYPKLMVDFTNGSENTLNSLNVDVHDMNGNLVHSQVAECNIRGGENQQLVMDIDLQLQTQLADYVVTVYPEGEEDLSDNKGTITVGYSDLALLVETKQFGSNTMVNVRIYNDSDLATNASLVVREGDPDYGITVDMRSLGVLNPGETYNYNYSYDISKMDFRGEDSKVYYYQVTGSAEELILGNNQESITFRNPAAVEVVPPTGIYTNAPDPVELNLDNLQTYQIKAKAEPEAAAGWTLLYASSDENVVTVDEKGLIKAVNEGTATILVQAENTEITKEINVVVKAPAAKKLTLKLKEITAPTTGYQVNDQYVIEVYGADGVLMENRLFKFSSTAPNNVAVDESGVVTLLRKGSAKINVTYQGTKTLKATSSITVVAEKPASVALNYLYNDYAQNVSILDLDTQTLKDSKIQLTPQVYNERGELMEKVTLTFKSSNTEVVKVDTNGKLTAGGKEGIAVVSATVKDSKVSTELTLYVFDSNKPLLTADSSIALNTYMMPTHKDAPVIQLQSIRSNNIRSVDYYLYQKDAEGNYVRSEVCAYTQESNNSGLRTLTLGFNQKPEGAKSGAYYMLVNTYSGSFYYKLDLKISRKIPEVQIKASSFNVFFTDQRSDLKFNTSETVENVYMTEATADKGKLTGAFSMSKTWNNETDRYEYYLTSTNSLRNGVEQNTLKKYNLKYKFDVYLQGYNTPVHKTITVPATYKVPTIKLSTNTIYAPANSSIYADLTVSATMDKKALPFVSTPYYSLEFANYSISVYNTGANGALTLRCYALQSGSVTGKLKVRDSSNWLHYVPVELTVTSKDPATNCKIAGFNVNAITKQEVVKPVVLGGKQVVKLNYRTLVNDELFYIYSDTNGVHVVPTAPSKEYGSKYKYKVDLTTSTGIQLKDMSIEITVSKTAPKITAPSKLYMNTDQRGRTIQAALSGNLNWQNLSAENTAIVVKKAKKVSGDLSVTYVGDGRFEIMTQQKCSGEYTVEITPALSNGEKLKAVKFTVACGNKPSVTAKVQGSLDMRKHLTSQTAVTLTLKNTSAKVNSVSIVNGFSSMFEIRETRLDKNNPVVYIGLKDGMDIYGGTHAVRLQISLSDGTTLYQNLSLKVICSNLSVKLPTVRMAFNARNYTVAKYVEPQLEDGAVITDICNADQNAVFRVSYANGYLTVTAANRAAVRKGTYTINCLVYASNDLTNGTGTPCKLKVVIR